MTQRRVFAQTLAPVLACVLMVHVAAGLLEQSKGDDGDQAEEVYDLGPGVVPPRIIKQVPPRHSNDRGVRVVGSVTMALVVGSKGIPRSLRVVKGLDKDVDRSVVEAVEQWRFAPAQKAGKPVAVRVTLEIAFHEM
jgi:TonB family protein